MSKVYNIGEMDLSFPLNLILDSNIVIQFLDKENTFNEEVHSKINELFLAGINFYYPAPALLEIKNYWRLKSLHDDIQFSLDTGFNFFTKFDKYFRNDVSPKRERNKYINDHDVKELRKICENIHSGKGIKRWLALCESSLSGEMNKIEETLKASNITYTNFGDKNLFLKEEKDQWPKWGTANNLIEKYAMASNDAAIMNMALSHRVDGFVSNDKDIIFAVKNGAYPSDKLFYTFLE